jgi:NIMA (never in mitosis gene a)-related kinase
MRRLGAETFQNVYNYLKEQRRGPNSFDVDENKIFEGLKKYTSNPSDCFLIDQLLFLEEM